MRRKFLMLLVAALLLGDIAAVGHLLTPAHRAAAKTVSGVTREFTLTAAPMKCEIQPGLVVDGWGYNGQIPGPTMRVNEGDLVKVHLINNPPEPTTVHWHGVNVPVAMDSVPGLTQDAVQPGDSFDYQFVANSPGTHMYHSHTDTDTQTQLGLYGALIIDPKQPDPEHFDREFTYILSEKSLDLTPDVALGNADILHRDAGNGRGGDLQKDLYLMNGKAGEAIDGMSIAPGQTIRIRLINLGNLVHAMHLHGHTFRIIATDGNPVPGDFQLTKNTVMTAPGETYDLSVQGDNPGVWMFHCRINNHAANGMTTTLTYDGYQPFDTSLTAHTDAHGAAAPLSAGSEGSAAPIPVIGAGDSHQHDAGASPAPTPTAAPSASPSSSASTASSADTTNGSAVSMADNRYVPAKLSVAAGTTVTWVNNGANLHNTTSFDGLWDSGVQSHGDSFSYTFDKPGTYRYICSQHGLEGMTGTITVTAPP